MDGNHFDQLAQEILKQKQLMENLEAENSELRQQIADLRSGRGIFVEIHGIRFALRDDSSLAQTNSSLATLANSSPSIPEVADSTPVATSSLNQAIMDQPTAALPSQGQEQNAGEQIPQAENDGDQQALNGESNFLEEIMIAEFNSALSSPHAVWQESTEKKPSCRDSPTTFPFNEIFALATGRRFLSTT